MCLGNEGVLLIALLDDDISKSTAAERRLLDFSGRIFQGSVFISGIYFALIGAKKTGDLLAYLVAQFWIPTGSTHSRTVASHIKVMA